MGEKILEVEHEPGEEYVIRFRPHRLGLLPEEARGHVYKARKEMLLALRSLIDRAIEHVEAREKGEGKGKKKGRTKIEIE
jgi:hypothetical protein